MAEAWNLEEEVCKVFLRKHIINLIQAVHAAVTLACVGNRLFLIVHVGIAIGDVKQMEWA